MDMRIVCLILLICCNAANASLSDLIKLRKDVDCEPDIEFTNASSVDPYLNYKWMAAGLPLIFWDSVRSGSLFNQSLLSRDCSQQLTSVADALDHDLEWGYRFIDSAGKTPSGVLRSSTTTYGEYDQCLDIQSHGIAGKYCMIDMHHLKRETLDGQLSLSRANKVVGLPVLTSLCLPSGCNADQVHAAIKHLLKPYMIKVSGDIHCDTADEISWYYKLTHLTTKQVTAVILISSIVTFVLIGTVVDVSLGGNCCTGRLSLFHKVSMRTVTQKLVYAKPFTFDIMLFDSFKIIILIGAVMAHAFVCFDTPLSFATFSNMEYFVEVASTYGTQGWLIDSGLQAFSFLSGMAIYLVVLPMMQRNRHGFSVASAILDRYTRFLPPIMILTACEFIWPIMGSGPLYTRVANFTLFKCERNWFYNLLFINNYFIDGIDVCGLHSFWSSIDMHLFLLGLVTMVIFSRSTNVGITFSIIMIVVGNIKVTYDAYVHQTIPGLFSIDMDPGKSDEFFTLIYNKTTSYIPAYFVGILVAYARSKGYLDLKLEGFWRNAIFLWMTKETFHTECAILSLYNVFRIIDRSQSWLIIALTRQIHILGFLMVFLYAGSLKPWWEKTFPSKDSEEERSTLVFHPFKALCRLGLSLYICNYLYIRYEFFTRRFVFHNNDIWNLHRIYSSTILVLLFALVFHILLLGPVDAIRQHLMT